MTQDMHADNRIDFVAKTTPVPIQELITAVTVTKFCVLTAQLTFVRNVEKQRYRMQKKLHIVLKLQSLC